MPPSGDSTRPTHRSLNWVWDVNLLTWVVMTQPGGGGGGGDASAANQVTGNASLSSIDGKTPALVGGRQPVDGSGVTQPVSGTFWQATQPVSGAFFQVTQPVSIAAAVSVTGTFWQATQPISVATLPLPAGAATLAGQTQPGVDIGDVTINNAAGVAAVNIQDGGNSITVDGAVTVSGTITEANSAAIAASLSVMDDWDEVDRAKINPIVGAVGIAGGTGVDATNVTRVSLATNVALPAGTNNIGDVDVLTMPVVAVTGTFFQATQPVSIAATVVTKETKTSTAAETSVSVLITNTVILASNANRLGATIYNESGAIVYMKLGTTASLTSYTIQIAIGGYYEVPFGFTGGIDGITVAITAVVRVTELTA